MNPKNVSACENTQTGTVFDSVHALTLEVKTFCLINYSLIKLFAFRVFVSAVVIMIIC